MAYLFMGIFVVIATVLDQLSKLWVVGNIPLHGEIPALDGIFHLTYAQNTGAAWSMLSGMQWLFLLIFLAFTLGIVWEFSKKRWPFTTFDRWCIAVVYAGGLGNIIDRIRLGYVVDMIEVEFIDFPVFNVADCYVTVGAVLLAVLVLFVYKEDDLSFLSLRKKNGRSQEL